MGPVHHARPVREEEIEDDPGPEPVGEDRRAGVAFAHREHVPERLRREDPLPDRQEVADTLAKSHLHSLRIDHGAARRRLGQGAEDAHRLGASPVEPEALEPLGEGEERPRHAAHRRAERRRARRGGRPAAAERGLSDRHAMVDRREREPEWQALPAEIGGPHVLREEEGRRLGGAGELVRHRLPELLAEQSPDEGNDQALGQRAVVAIALVHAQHEPAPVLQHGLREAGRPLGRRARGLGAQHQDGPRLHRLPRAQDGVDRIAPLERVVVPVEGGRVRHPDDGNAAESERELRRRLVGRRAVHLDEHRGLPGQARVEPGLDGRGNVGQRRARARRDQPHGDVGRADPRELDDDVFGEIDRVHGRLSP